jgi:hypothetical protein
VNEEATRICDDHLLQGCRTTCPIKEACKYRPGDTRELFAARVNAAADEIEKGQAGRDNI